MRIDPRNTPFFWWMAILVMCLMITLAVFFVDDMELKQMLISGFLGVIAAAWNTIE